MSKKFMKIWISFQWCAFTVLAIFWIRAMIERESAAVLIFGIFLILKVLFIAYLYHDLKKTDNGTI